MFDPYLRASHEPLDPDHIGARRARRVMSEKPKVVGIRPGIRIEEKEAAPAGEPKVNEEVVEALQAILDHAKTGEVRGFAIALAHAEGHSDFYLGLADYALVGILEGLKLQLLYELAQLDEDEGDE